MDRVEALEEENNLLKKEVDLLKGIVFKYDAELHSLRQKMTDLTARSMNNNITIAGLAETQKGKKEKCKEVVSTFLQEQMEITFDNKDILVAHCVGQPRQPENPRIMVVRCEPSLHKKILSNTKNLKEKKNEHDKPYFFHKQLPEQWMEEKRECREQIKEAKAKAQKAGQEVEITVQDRVVYVNHQPVRKYLTVPKYQELFADRAEQEKIDQIKMFHSDPVMEEGSRFQAFAAKFSSVTEIRRAYVKMKQKLH